MTGQKEKKITDVILSDYTTAYIINGHGKTKNCRPGQPLLLTAFLSCLVLSLEDGLLFFSAAV